MENNAKNENKNLSAAIVVAAVDIIITLQPHLLEWILQ